MSPMLEALAGLLLVFALLMVLLGFAKLEEFLKGSHKDDDEKKGDEPK